MDFAVILPVSSSVSFGASPGFVYFPFNLALNFKMTSTHHVSVYHVSAVLPPPSKPSLETLGSLHLGNLWVVVGYSPILFLLLVVSRLCLLTSTNCPLLATFFLNRPTLISVALLSLLELSWCLSFLLTDPAPCRDTLNPFETGLWKRSKSCPMLLSLLLTSPAPCVCSYGQGWEIRFRAGVGKKVFCRR